MDLFKSKESFKEKVDSNNNWKAAWPRMILEWHLFLRLSLGFVWKMLSFVGRCLFVFCIFYLNEKELNQQVCLIKWVVLVHDTRSKDLRSNDAWFMNKLCKHAHFT